VSKKRKKSKAAPRPDVWDGMSRAQWDDLAEYVREVANRIELRDWAFRLDRLPLGTKDDDRDAYAMVTVVYGRKLARIAFCHEWNTIAADERRHVVVHELLHCHVNQVHILLSNQLPSMIGDHAWEPINQSIRFQTEHIVDALADALAPHMPTIRTIP